MSADGYKTYRHRQDAAVARTAARLIVLMHGEGSASRFGRTRRASGIRLLKQEESFTSSP